MTRLHLALPAIAMFVLAGCPTPEPDDDADEPNEPNAWDPLLAELEDGFCTDLTRGGQTPDIHFFKNNPDETVAVELRVPGLGSEALDSESTVSRSYDLADDPEDVWVALRFGENLGWLYSDDMNIEVDIYHSFGAQVGTIDVEVTPETSFYVDTDVELQGLVFDTDLGPLSLGPCLMGGGVWY